MCSCVCVRICLLIFCTCERCLSVLSFPECYAAEFSALPIAEEGKLEGSVPLEHLITCIPGVTIVTAQNGFKIIKWIHNKPPQPNAGVCVCLCLCECVCVSLSVCFFFSLHHDCVSDKAVCVSVCVCQVKSPLFILRF